MKAWMKAGAVLIALGGLAGAMPAVQAQGDPTIEACTRYAEADFAFQGAEAEADAAYEAAEKAAKAAFEAAAYEGGDEENKALPGYDEAYAAYDATIRDINAISNTHYRKAVAAREAALKEAEAARDAAIEEGRYVLTETYLAIYAEGGGVKSDVWDVMVKLLNNQRDRCWQLYGL